MTDVSISITRAINELNGSIDYNEREIVDEPVNAKSIMVIWEPLIAKTIVRSDDEVATPKWLATHEQVANVYLNYKSLLAAGLTKEVSLKVALLRTMILNSGGYYPKDGDFTIARNCYKPEIRIERLPQDALFEPTHRVLKRPSGEKVRVPITSQLSPDEEDQVVAYEGVKFQLPAADNDFMTALTGLMDSSLKQVMKYLPIMAHMAFMKFGHHYLNADYWKVSYAKQFKSLQMSAIESAWNNVDIIYNAVHWMGPQTMRLWCKNLLKRGHMPRALAIKFPIMPAGVALISSTVAVLKAAAAIPGFSVFFEVYAKPWELVQVALQKIRQNPYAYHVRHDLFGEESLEATLQEAKEAAATLAPIAQAFINKYAQGTDLARVQALKKHAEANISLLKRYEAIFVGTQAKVRAEARTSNLRDLIIGATKTAAPPPAVEEVFE